MNKINPYKILVIIGIVLLGLFFSSCSSPAQTEEAPPPEEVEEVEEVEEMAIFTLESLAEYDGKDGKPAYVAVDGIVYDFTELGRWRGGSHNGFEAGQDLTQAIQNASPHGVSVLNRAPIVGTLED